MIFYPFIFVASIEIIFIKTLLIINKKD